MKRLTRPTSRVLAVLLGAPGEWRYGYDLMKTAELSSGTLYPLLARLTDDGWLDSRWEESSFPGKPPRQLYRLTATGRLQAREVMERGRATWLPRMRTGEI